MFEVIIKKEDGTTETWDCINELQASFVFFKAKSKQDTIAVEMNEFNDDMLDE